ncbi:hypothetical protein HMPREF0975_01291, partial [Actinomyces sp. oral taxon 849 str. F0330]
ASLRGGPHARWRRPRAPPHGLTLEEVVYPDDDDLAARAERARATRRLTC